MRALGQPAQVGRGSVDRREGKGGGRRVGHQSDEDAAEATVLVEGLALAVLDAAAWIVLDLERGDVEKPGAVWVAGERVAASGRQTRLGLSRGERGPTARSVAPLATAIRTRGPAALAPAHGPWASLEKAGK